MLIIQRTDIKETLFDNSAYMQIDNTYDLTINSNLLKFVSLKFLFSIWNFQSILIHQHNELPKVQEKLYNIVT